MTSRALKGQRVAPRVRSERSAAQAPLDAGTVSLFAIVVKMCATCGAEYTAEEWARLQAGGAQHVEADEEGPALTLELRHCVCGSTLALEWTPL